MNATVVIAPDSFKGSASAAEIASALAAGWSACRQDDDIVLAPMADGGEGTLQAFQRAHPEATARRVTVTGPDGRPVNASWLMLPDRTAIVEVASTSGLGLLSELAPMDAHTLGFGEAIASALDGGAERLLLALGGSSSTDGGVGALTALGARFLDEDDQPVPLGGRGLGRIRRSDLSGLMPPPPGGMRVLGDVVSPLTGPSGAAHVYGPQKGATPEQITELDAGLVQFAHVLGRRDVLGAGAAGGTAYAMGIWGATFSSGAAAVGEAICLPALFSGATVVITGEGRFDSQSTKGKVSGYVADLARASGATCCSPQARSAPTRAGTSSRSRWTSSPVPSRTLSSDPVTSRDWRALGSHGSTRACVSTERRMNSPGPGLGGFAFDGRGRQLGLENAAVAGEAGASPVDEFPCFGADCARSREVVHAKPTEIDQAQSRILGSRDASARRHPLHALGSERSTDRRSHRALRSRRRPDGRAPNASLPPAGAGSPLLRGASEVLVASPPE